MLMLWINQILVHTEDPRRVNARELTKVNYTKRPNGVQALDYLDHQDMLLPNNTHYTYIFCAFFMIPHSNFLFTMIIHYTGSLNVPI